jgi:hypothetical protein
MSRLGKFSGFLVLGAGLCISLASTGCATRVSYYDEDHHDYHRWNNHEVVVYRSYYETNHRPYREYNSLSKDEQHDYWKWRHEHH